MISLDSAGKGLWRSYLRKSREGGTHGRFGGREGGGLVGSEYGRRGRRDVLAMLEKSQLLCRFSPGSQVVNRERRMPL